MLLERFFHVFKDTCHCLQLCLASAYAAYATAHDSADVKRQKRRLDPSTFEPMFSNIAKDFMGTLDYILYTTDSLVRFVGFSVTFSDLEMIFFF